PRSAPVLGFIMALWMRLECRSIRPHRLIVEFHLTRPVPSSFLSFQFRRASQDLPRAVLESRLRVAPFSLLVSTLKQRQRRWRNGISVLSSRLPQLPSFA